MTCQLAGASTELFHQSKLQFHSESTPIFAPMPNETSSPYGTFNIFDTVRALLAGFSGKPFFYSLQTLNARLLSDMLTITAWTLHIDRLERHLRELQREASTQITRRTIARFTELRRKTADTRYELTRAKQAIPVTLEEIFNAYKHSRYGISQNTKDKVCSGSYAKPAVSMAMHQALDGNPLPSSQLSYLHSDLFYM